MAVEPRCERPQLGEPGSSWARSCGECAGCRGDERQAAASADGFVAVEISPEQAERLLELVRTPVWHKAGDTPIVEAVERALAVYQRNTGSSAAA